MSPFLIARWISADSIPTGDRSRWYLYLYVFGTLAGVVGPIITVFGFMYWGNQWTLPELRKVRTPSLFWTTGPVLVNHSLVRAGHG
jgi:hypothetical protein